MRENTRTGRRIFSGIILICIICLAIISLGSGFEGLHECTGENCLICLLCAVRESIMNGSGLVLCLFGSSLLASGILRGIGYTQSNSACLDTPVCLKVKLSN